MRLRSNQAVSWPLLNVQQPRLLLNAPDTQNHLKISEDDKFISKIQFFSRWRQSGEVHITTYALKCRTNHSASEGNQDPYVLDLSLMKGKAHDFVPFLNQLVMGVMS